jgi:hypothetical protein
MKTAKILILGAIAAAALSLSACTNKQQQPVYEPAPMPTYGYSK